MKLKADIQRMNTASDELIRQNNNLNQLAAELDSVISILRRQSEFSNVISAIKVIQSNLYDERYQLFNLGQALSEIGMRYTQTETDINETLDGDRGQYKISNATTVYISNVGSKLKKVLDGR